MRYDESAFFDSVSEEAEALLFDLYEYSHEIRELIHKKGRPYVDILPLAKARGF
ncbi:hypothetical protein HpCHC45_15090 [Helicobacter pylori]